MAENPTTFLPRISSRARARLRQTRLWKRGYGGEGGIRTLGTLASSTVFETAPFDHSGTSPHEDFAPALSRMGRQERGG